MKGELQFDRIVLRKRKRFEQCIQEEEKKNDHTVKGELSTNPSERPLEKPILTP